MTQIMSRNGKILKKMLDETDTIPVTMEDSVIKWTRSRKRLSSIEKSVIDYVIMTQNMKDMTKLVYVDATGSFILNGKEETDHSTIITGINMPTTNKHTNQDARPRPWTVEQSKDTRWDRHTAH